jgi:hypothetical protein
LESVQGTKGNFSLNELFKENGRKPNTATYPNTELGKSLQTIAKKIVGSNFSTLGIV